MFIFHYYCCCFVPEIRILFSFRLKHLIIWWWLENSCLSRRLDEFYISEKIVNFFIYETWAFCWCWLGNFIWFEMSMTSSSSTLPLFFFVCFLFIYNSWIFYMFSSTYVLSLPLYIFSLSANILWIWNTWSSILLWTRLLRL